MDKMHEHHQMEMPPHSGMEGHSTMKMPMVETASGEPVHVMPGIPLWMAITGIVLIILLTHLLLARKKTGSEGRATFNFDLFRFKPLRRLVQKSYFPLLAQSLSVFLFLLVLAAGLFGNQRSNIAPVLTWTWWWVLLIFMVLGFGKIFCTICPWEAISSMVTSLSLKSRVKKLGFEYRWPKWARNIFPAIIFFIVLTWFELGHDVTRSGPATATLGLVMLGMAVFSAIYFERRAFCRYGCLVGRISGLYALFSPIELRARSAQICSSCTTKDCYKGNEEHTGCPTFLFPSKLQENTYCTLCTECVRSCPHENIGINLRPLAADLFDKVKFQWDESILAVVLLALTSFHGVTMTPVWRHLNDLLRVETGLGPTICFTFLMALMLLLPLLIFWAGAKAARGLTLEAGVSTSDIFKAFTYSLIPIALFYHLAHNSMHFFREAQNLLPILSDPFGYGWNLFGTASKSYGPLLSMQTIWYLQLAFILIGHLYGVLIADRVARVLFKNSRHIFKSLIPLLITMILYSAFSVWLIAQPMEMRTGM